MRRIGTVMTLRAGAQRVPSPRIGGDAAAPAPLVLLVTHDPAPGDHTACPSSACRPGAVLVGIVLPNGRIAYAADHVEIDDEFVRRAHTGRPPEQRFRFSSPCMKSACAQWAGTECGLIDRLLGEFERQFGPPVAPDPLPVCPIRDECRWFRQRQGLACAVCNYVVTDMARPDAELPREVIKRRAKYAGAT